MKQIFGAVILLSAGLVSGFYLREFTCRPAAIAPLQNAPNGTARVLEKDKGATLDLQTVSTTTITNELSLSDIQTALDQLKNIADMRERSAAFTAIMRRWAELDGRAAFQYLNSMGEGEMKAQAMVAVAKVLAKSDPQFLADMALAMPGTRSRREAIQELTSAWAKTDAARALAWADQLPDDRSKKDALAIICFQQAQQNPEAASLQLSRFTGDSRNSLITAVASQWGLRDPLKAIQWANTLADTEKTLAISGLIGAWAERDPVGAGTYATQLPAGEMQNQAAMSVVSTWANRNPTATADWVIQFPNGDVREQGIRELVNAWTRIDSDGARDWTKGLPAGSIRDFAMETFSESMAYWSPDKAAEVADLIDDPLKRAESIEVTWRSWMETDPTSAQNWLAQLNLAPDLKTHLESLQSTN